MNEAIEAEVISEKLVELKQKPIIIYDLVKAKGLEVQNKISSLGLDTLEANEENLKVLKATRSELSRDFKTYEEQRKLIKDLVMKPYNEFEDAYKKYISILFTGADKDLKAKVDVVEDGILNQKIEALKEYFSDVNMFDFINFEDLDLKIIRSKSDKLLKEEIDEYLRKVKQELTTIETLANKDRVMAKYQIYKDFNRAISDVNIEMERERQIAEQKARREEDELLRRQQYEKKMAEAEVIYEPILQEPIAEKVEEKPSIELITVSFKATGTRENLKALKEFARINNIKLGSL